MPEPVSSKTLLMSERLVALITLMWLLASVDEQVCGEITSPSEGLAADSACVWVLASVEEHVCVFSNFQTNFQKKNSKIF